MQIFRSRPVAAIAMAAALSLTATPAFARGDWGHRHRDRGLDGGDVFAGLLVLGGIAAIASAASNKTKENREPEPRYPDSDYRADDTYREPVPDYADSGDDRADGSYGYRSGNLDGVVDSCVGEVERGENRVDSVDTVNREGDGWRVQGRAGTHDFACTVDRDGRIRGVTLDGSAR